MAVYILSSSKYVYPVYCFFSLLVLKNRFWTVNISLCFVRLFFPTSDSRIKKTKGRLSIGFVQHMLIGPHNVTRVADMKKRRNKQNPSIIRMILNAMTINCETKIWQIYY